MNVRAPVSTLVPIIMLLHACTCQMSSEDIIGSQEVAEYQVAEFLGIQYLVSTSPVSFI